MEKKKQKSFFEGFGNLIRTKEGINLYHLGENYYPASEYDLGRIMQYRIERKGKFKFKGEK